jgi:protoheme IX farnesyltransferase
MASPGRPPLGLFIAASIGIALVAGSAAAINCLVERTVDAMMARTRWRATARGEVSVTETLILATLVGGCGLWILYAQVNPLTMWLTLATFLGYAVIYTLVLKPATPMNIVIGGASGAMPPLLGWVAITGHVGPEALALFLIIFIWTPPHFWSLACYRREEYARAGLPMLPVTHGVAFTCLQSLLYVVMLAGATVLPYALRMSGPWYLVAALILDVIFLGYAYMLWRHYSDGLARRTFRWSILYLTLLFAALLADHFL